MSGYSCDLDKLEEGSRLGVMRKSDGTLHFFVNGEDCGVAATSVPSGNIVLIRSFLFFFFFMQFMLFGCYQDENLVISFCEMKGLAFWSILSWIFL